MKNEFLHRVMPVIQTKGGGPDNLVLLKFIWDIGLWD